MMDALLAAALVMAGGDLPAADDYRPYRVERMRPALERHLEDDDDVIWEPSEPVKRRKPATRWILRIEGEKREYYVPIPVMKELGLRAGTIVSEEMSRLIAQKLGAKYPPEILEKLEKLK